MRLYTGRSVPKYVPLQEGRRRTLNTCTTCPSCDSCRRLNAKRLTHFVIKWTLFSPLCLLLELNMCFPPQRRSLLKTWTKKKKKSRKKTQTFKVRLGEHALFLPFKQTYGLMEFLWSRKLILHGKNTDILHFAKAHLLWIRKIQLYSWTHKAWKLGHSSA